MKLKAFLREFFYIPKHGKVREKVMLAHITLSVVMMVGCLAVMTLSAYAYFSHSASTGYITIQSAQFDVEVSIKDSTGDIEVKQVSGGVYGASLNANTKYTVTVKGNGNAATGFCIVSAKGNDHDYHTQQIATDSNVNNSGTDSLTFLLRLNYPADVTFTAHWGTSSYFGSEDEHYITDSVEIDTKGDNVNENGITTYTIQEGDILSDIALRFSTTVERIKAYNELESDSIQATQTILIPPEDRQMPVTSNDVNSISDLTNDEESSTAETTTAVTETNATETESPDANSTTTAQTTAVTESDPASEKITETSAETETETSTEDSDSSDSLDTTVATPSEDEVSSDTESDIEPID